MGMRKQAQLLASEGPSWSDAPSALRFLLLCPLHTSSVHKHCSRRSSVCVCVCRTVPRSYHATCMKYVKVEHLTYQRARSPNCRQWSSSPHSSLYMPEERSLLSGNTSAVFSVHRAPPSATARLQQLSQVNPIVRLVLLPPLSPPTR